MSKISAIIPAAGSGTRMGGDRSKQYLAIGERPILIETLMVFNESPHIDEIILLSPPADIDLMKKLLKKYDLAKVTKVVKGGKERQDSISNALDALDRSSSIVLVHDGVRPFISDKIIKELIDAVNQYGAAIAAVPVKDTVKKVSNRSISGISIIETVPRENLWLAQTPQAFRAKLIIGAYANAREKGIRGTDDASLLEAIGVDVKIVMGSYENIKITTPEDLVFAEAILKERSR
ncbi:MAG: 2-C-methyl-D-erythritol 4-phosphate cytidylyltransferase [bacterium]|nr:2-C-methyl-D-erythritol 4-phosphate cytidylyltransferase [bacterium]